MTPFINAEALLTPDQLRKLTLRNEICRVLKEAGDEGMTPTALSNTVFEGRYSYQAIAGNIAYMPAGLVERKEFDTGKTAKTRLTYHLYRPIAGTNTYEYLAPGTEIDIPIKKIVYYWKG